MANKLHRRAVLGGFVAAAALLPLRALALNADQARALVDRIVADINRVINSGASERRMLGQFQQIFQSYANTTVIAFRVLGADARRASDRQKRDFVEAFEGYISRKYGRRFREFVGGQVIVERAHPVKSWFEVQTAVHLQGQDPFRVDFLIREAGGQSLFFDMLIEGISLTRVEREEIGSMLDSRGGDLDRLIADLRNAG